ncbi:MAG: hypothetical protein ISS79_13015 [Phycisphaerae bacterium]|nr:hypothetical protein [Phycisphaerae bacterium]
MSGRRSRNGVWWTLLVIVAVVSRTAAGSVATNPDPADGAVARPEVFEPNLYLLLEFSLGLGAVSHTGYFSDAYGDIASRDPAHCLGSPPYPQIFPTGYFVGWDAPEVPKFARASLERGKTYFWCVDEFDGQRPWPGNIWTFTVMREEAGNPDPPDGATSVVPNPNITLTWERGDIETAGYEIRYRIYYGTDRDEVEAATTPIVDIATRSYEISGLASATHYFWRVDTVQRRANPPFQTTVTPGNVWTFKTSDNTIYVDDDATGANDGTSWANAYKYLQDALAKANASPKPLEIHVAQGTYRPDETTLHLNGTGDRFASFELINAVTIEGGYAGFAQAEPDQRNIEEYRTVLSGDLNGDDVGDVNDPSQRENSCHVVTGSHTDRTAILDGFTITSGYADNLYGTYTKGGGILVISGSPSLTNCKFVRNVAHLGGAMYSVRSEAILTNCVFSGNLSTYLAGGIYNSNSNLTFVDCAIVDNSAAHSHGGVENTYSNGELRNCVFRGNSCKYAGAGMSNYHSSPILINCTFAENWTWSDSGGGMHNNFESSPMMFNCTFSRNTASGPGGGIYNSSGCNPILRNCTFVGNSAGGTNWAGGGMDNIENSAIVINSIFWKNSPKQIRDNWAATSVTYSNVQGSWPGKGNIYANPLFVNPDGSDYHLLSNSPCINTGDPNFIAGPNDVDMDGEKRVMLGRADMGADEFNPLAVEFVVVNKQRVDRTVFEYECQIALENVSTFVLKDVSLRIAEASENMTVIEPDVAFGDIQLVSGESVTSTDTCTFRVDRSRAIDPAGIIWHITAELADTGATMQHTVSTPPPPDPQTDLDGLKNLAEKWLWQGTAGAIEEDSVQDGTVNLADFAKFADQWRKK